MDSSSALESYGPLLYNAPSLANIGAVLAMIQHETSSLTLDVKSMKHKTMQFSFINQQSLYEGVRPRPLTMALLTGIVLMQLSIVLGYTVYSALHAAEGQIPLFLN